MKNLKLLLITRKVDELDPRSGFFHDWINLLSKTEGIKKLTVLCLNEGKYSLPESINIVSMGKEKKYNKVRIVLQFYKEIISLSKDYDSVLVHMAPIWMVLGGPIFWIMGKKRYLWYTLREKSVLLKIAQFFSKKVFSASNYSYPFNSKKLISTGHGINLDKFNQKQKYRRDKILKIITIGRISPVKRLEDFIRALSLIENKQIDFEATIIGDCTSKEDENYLQSILRLIKDEKLEEKIKYKKGVSPEEIVDYYRENDIFVNLSDTDSVDKTILEAMAMEKLILTTNYAFKNIFGKYEDMMIAKKYDIKNIANKIINLNAISNDEREKIGKDLRKIILEKHEINRLMKRLVKEMRR